MLTTRYLKIHVHAVGKFIDGEPMTIIYNGELLVKNCLQANLSAKEIDFKLRSAGVLDISQVKRAILEQNGSITILGKYDEDVRFPVIIDGKVDTDVLQVMDKDQQWLDHELDGQGIVDIKDVYMAKYRHHKWEIATYGSQDEA